MIKMKTIEVEKEYTKDIKIQYIMHGSNIAEVYVNGQRYSPAERVIEVSNPEDDMDELCAVISKHNPQTWIKKYRTYQQKDPNYTPIPYGFVIKRIETYPNRTEYIADYAKKQIIHEGLIEEIEWKRALYNEWNNK